MKTLFICLMVLSCYAGSSQVSPNQGTLVITSLSAYNICKDMNFTVNFKYHITGVPTNFEQYTFDYHNSINQVWPGRTVAYDEIFHLTKNFNGTDTIYSFVLNPSTGTVPPPLGNYLFIVMPDNSFPGKTLGIYDCTITGIEEYKLDSLKPVYFDLRGNKIDRRENELIIEQVGINRRKIFIQE